MIRTAGEIDYELTYKKVKRINLRIRQDGSVAVSAHKRVTYAELDRFVAEHAQWIDRARARMNARSPMPTAILLPHSDEECIAVFMPVLERYHPLVCHVHPEQPRLRIRQMKSRWGVCYPTKNIITLNKQLLDKPLAALEYVVLHELVHFIHYGHQADFHATMARLMPDYKERRKLLGG